MTYRVAIAVSGRGSNLVALCDAVAADPDIVVAVVISERQVPALERAAERGIGTHILADHRDPDEWRRVLDGVRADLLVLAGYLKLVPDGVVSAMSGRVINIHPALLPNYGGPGMYGRRVHEAVLAAGDPESGATVHLVDEMYDRGQVLGQARVPVLPADTAESLAARVLAMEHRLLPAAVRAASAAGHPVPFELAK